MSEKRPCCSVLLPPDGSERSWLFAVEKRSSSVYLGSGTPFLGKTKRIRVVSFIHERGVSEQTTQTTTTDDAQTRHKINRRLLIQPHPPIQHEPNLHPRRRHLPDGSVNRLLPPRSRRNVRRSSRRRSRRTSKAGREWRSHLSVTILIKPNSLPLLSSAVLAELRDLVGRWQGIVPECTSSINVIVALKDLRYLQNRIFRL